MRNGRNSRVFAIGALAAVLVAALGIVSTSDAKQTAAQKSFRKILLDDSAVDPAVKLLLREGGFVERRMTFSDFTGEGKTDAVIFVNSGAISGTVASYVLSAERGRELRVVHVDESGYQVVARANQQSGATVANLVLEDPVFSAGDPPCCARVLVRRTYQWNTRAREFKLVARKRIRSGVELAH